MQIFGYFPQTIQGADILASDTKHPRKVFMPDFFKGKPAPLDAYPPTTDEHKKILADFFAGPADAKKMIGEVEGLIKALQTSNPSITSWGILGYCWGAKIANLVSVSGTTFKAAAQCHPAFVAAEDAEKVTIPMCMLASGDEPVDDVNAYEKALKTDKHVEIFKGQVHGWMAARGKLDEGTTERKEYERGYKTLLHFFAQHL
ncbi:MAG: hypothetical protein M1814_004660 [Vezdaea aestivalis]|nr:MAG: hypothetical protein M1814_004660 [Vezdaea aestivalis]